MPNKVTCHLDPSDVAALVRLLDYAMEHLEHIENQDTEHDSPYNVMVRKQWLKARELGRFFKALNTGGQ